MKNSPKIIKYLDRALQVCLFLLALSAPISIAATQTAWSFALLFWIIRAFFAPPKLRKGGMDLAILAFVGLSLVSSFFSYEPEVSLRKMVAVSLVTIVYLVSENISGTKMLRRLIAILLIAGTFTAAFAIGTFVIGKNLKVIKLSADSPLRAAGVQENDTILSANGKSVSSPDQLAAAVDTASENGFASVKVYRFENVWDINLPISTLEDARDSAGKFGIAEWSRGRDTRASGFYIAI